MKKSMYSLMLSEQVVEAIDRLALEQNTNRSRLINEILADYLSLVTPEKHIADGADCRARYERQYPVLKKLSCIQIPPNNPLRGGAVPHSRTQYRSAQSKLPHSIARPYRWTDGIFQTVGEVGKYLRFKAVSGKRIELYA